MNDIALELATFEKCDRSVTYFVAYFTSDGPGNVVVTLDREVRTAEDVAELTRAVQRERVIIDAAPVILNWIRLEG